MTKTIDFITAFSIWSTTALMAQEIKIQGIIVDKKMANL